MRGNLALYLGDAGKRAIPARLKLRGNQAICRIRRVILPEAAIGGITGRFEITAERFANLIPLMCGLGCGGRSRRNGAGSDNAEQCPFDRIIDAQATERDAARFAVVIQPREQL